MLTNTWKSINLRGYTSNYQVSKGGEVRSIRKDKILSTTPDRGGYLRVSLWKNNKRREIRVHRLVALTHVTGYSKDLVVNHIDRDKTNNNVGNLEWVTQKYNTRCHAQKTYEVTYPDGRVQEITGLNEFCDSEGLSAGSMCMVSKGLRPQHKGFTIIKLGDK